MTNRTLWVACAGAAALMFAARAAVAEPAETTEPLTDAATIERGRYIVMTAACHDCHTPWNEAGPDLTRMLQGHPETERISSAPALEAPWIGGFTATNTAWSGPWGVSFTANLTPDDETGLGKWTVRMFIDTIRNGRHKGRGRLLLPPMPIPVYQNFTDEDLTAIFAYLQTIPAIRNRVPEPIAPVMVSSSN